MTRPSSTPSSTVVLHHVVDAAPHLPADAPVVVLGPSLGSTLAMWEPQARALSERFRVIRYDTRGHGGSPSPDGPYAIDDLADDVLALLDALGVARAHLVGLSLGGMTAMALAARVPERVDHLVLACTTARFDDLDPWRARVATVRSQGTAAIAEGVAGRWFTPGFAAGHPGVLAAARDWIAGSDDAGYAACCEAIIAMDLRDRLASITAPTLVISGSADPATPPEHQERIAAAVAGARLESLAAAHLANLEHPERFTALLANHCETGR